MMFNLPIGLKVEIEKRAEQDGLTASALVRKAIADVVGFELPVGLSRAKKYGSDEERKAAQKSRDKARRDLIKDLLAKYRAGELDLDGDDD